jgi:hypothetical protein
MAGLEDQLSAVLSDPQMMQKLMTMAQSLGASPPAQETQPSPPAMPEIDLGMLQKFSGLAHQGSIDPNQRSLLHALGPYLSTERIGRLEKAMKAAKMAKFASGFLGQGINF